MKWLVILLLLAPGAAFPQPRGARAKPAAPPKGPAQQQSADAPAATRWPIESLAVEGNHNYTSQQVLAVAGLKVGQLAGKKEFDEASKRLEASGAFEMVGYRFEPGPNKQGYVATFQVTEVEPAYPVRFEELPVPAADVEKMLHAKDPLFSTAKLPSIKPVLDRYVAWLQEYLASKGSQEKIAARLVPVGTDQFAIVFRPARNLPAVAQVTFDGNKAVPTTLLQDAISGVAIGTGYTEDRFRELLNTSVRPAYEARGYLRVKFAQVRAEPAKDVQGLHVFVTVDEGEPYKLGKVAIAGPTPLRPEELLKAGAFKPDEVANFDQVNEGQERVRQALRRSGFMNAQVSTERVIDDGKKTVDLAIHVDAGPRYSMGKLTIVGLDLNGEYEIKRIWALKEGRPFNPDYPKAFLDRSRDLFDNLGETKSEVKINEQDHTADVTLTFAGSAPKKPKQQVP